MCTCKFSHLNSFASVKGAGIFFAIVTDRRFANMTGMGGSLKVRQCDIAPVESQKLFKIFFCFLTFFLSCCFLVIFLVFWIWHFVCSCTCQN